VIRSAASGRRAPASQRLLGASLLVSLLALAACGGSSQPQPQPDAGPTPTCLDAAPCALASGIAQTGTISQVGQVDVYTVSSSSASRTLVKLLLTDPAPVTPVRFTMLLLGSDGHTPIGVRGPVPGTGAQTLAGTFLLPGPGTYKLLVRDVTAQKVDLHNPYTLTATLIADPDAQEPDDTPPQARPLAPAAIGAAPATASGFVASSGDLDLIGFDLSTEQLVRVTATQAAAGGTLRLRLRLLQRDTTAPDQLSVASTLLVQSALTPGGALAFDQTRALAPGRYLVALDDTPLAPATVGTESDERAAAQWTVGLSLVADPDPNEQTTRNDTPATATTLNPGDTKYGAIGSQGDADWYEIALPQTSTPQILEVTLDPQKANQLLALNWSVGTVVAHPTAACDTNCGPSAFCVNQSDGGAGLCGYTAHAVHHFMRATGGSYDATVESVRLRHFGPAETVRVVIDDQGGADRSNELYKLSARLFADPDANEQSTVNDTIPAATPDPRVDDGNGAFHITASGKISWWDFIDEKTQRNNPGDLDYFAADLPPRLQAPDCPADAGPPDGGPNHLADGGVCGPDPYDGGVVYQPSPDYALVMHWNNPSDGDYRIGMQGVVRTPSGGSQGCLFSFDDQYARQNDAGTWTFGDDLINDPCFCLASASADLGKIWLAAESTHRPTAPAGNAYSDNPYDFTLTFTPVHGDGGLSARCQGVCHAPQPGPCPGR
jgi:hypothetical protein